MKKSILTLLVLFVCAIQTTTAYEYFTIYFSDGTKSEAFYATDVDSICYSKLSLDSIAYNDWQIQEIYTCDSVYRYPLAQIDSLSFKDVDEDKVAKYIAQVIVKTDSLLATVDNIEVLKSALPIIRQIEEVDDAYINNQTLFVDIKDWGCINYYFPLDEKDVNNNSMSRQLATPRHSQSIKVHQHSHPLSACIVNQQQRDEGRAWFGTIAGNVHDAFVNMGISCEIINMPDPHFFNNEIFNYDLVFLKTHGYYDTKYGLHWLFTGEELLCHDAKITSFDSTYVKIKQILKNRTYSPLKMTFSRVDEIRNGYKTHVYYTVISEEFIRTAKRKFKNVGSAIVFNTACESMMGNIANYNNMAKAFLNRGAGSYFGYDDSNSIGAYGGSSFFFYLLNGLSVSDSYNILPDWCKEQNIFLYYDNNGDLKTDYKKESGRIYVKQYHPYLLVEPEGQSLCIKHPETIEINDNFGIDGTIKLQGKMGLLKSLKIDDGVSFSYDNHTFGFQYSTYSDMSQADSIKAEGNYDSSTLYMNWEATLDQSNLKPNTTYYYRAYMNDGYSNCYGEIKSFTTPNENNKPDENAEEYFVWDSKNKIATYYYDGKCAQRGGRKYTYLSEYNPVKVTFDKSFSNYYPTGFSFKFCYDLQSIENLNYLNTDDIRKMRNMFDHCHSLTSLDLSHFNTSKVTDMSGMFDNCHSLTSLDLGHFDTSNVTSMSRMFVGCRSLTDLDISSFNTANVTNMNEMFYCCNSLVSLDLSHFNTSKVTDMGVMFSGCSSLTSLDVSNFIVSEKTIVDDMFSDCSSLTVLDLSSFKTVHHNTALMFTNCSSLQTIYAGNWAIDGQNSMFGNCTNLVGGQGTKIGDNLYGYDEEGNPLYYGCSEYGWAAHIDGGKDHPGLFTAK